ncbi:tail assembly chaperone [Arthrobacter phage EastWest]|uniref:Tail assembly chaperone n=1 Tax=Arthrobacter phage EastWest TaxID=2894292 RepID=A0AAE8YP29_9CAUD|nr:tail assembly chaperone [Arthrobacter phage EastWest]
MTETTFGDYNVPADAEPEAPFEPEQTAPAPAPAPRRARLSEIAKSSNPFDELKAEAERDLDKFVTYENALRPGWFMRFKAVIDAREIKRYQQAAQGRGKKSRPEDADLIKGNSVLLHEKCVAILRGGIDDEHIVVDDDGDELTFQSEEFIDLFTDDSGTVQAALQKFLGDAQIMKLAGSILGEAGYDDEMQPVDPTNG